MEYKSRKNKSVKKRVQKGRTSAPSILPVRGRDRAEVFDTAYDGVLLMHADTGLIANVNETFLQQTGYSRDDILGKRIGELEALANGFSAFSLFPVPPDMERIYYGELELKTKEGKILAAELVSSVHGVAAGKMVQYNFRDVTERKRIERSRPRSEDQFRRLFDTNPHPMWVFDGKTLAILAVNASASTAYGYEQRDFLKLSMREILLPDELPEFLDSIRNVRPAVLKPDVWKHRRKNGDVLSVEVAMNEIVFNSRPAQFAVATDVTAREQTMHLLKETRRVLQKMLSALPIGVLILDSNGHSIIGNPAIRQIWGGQPYRGIEQYNEYTGWRVNTGTRLQAEDWAGMRAVKRGETTLDEVIEIENLDGMRKVILDSAVPLKDSQGRIAGAIIVNQDITERRKQEDELKRVQAVLERQATTDTLTGIFNRLKFNELLAFELRETERYEKPLSLIMFDIDRFKAINDGYGHLVGDAVLQELARLVSANVRSVDVFARWGGEEFVILSANIAIDAAQQLAEKLRTLVEQNRFSCPCTVTSSFGVTQFLPGDTSDSFIKRVDDAMYRAKERGRNAVIVV